MVVILLAMLGLLQVRDVYVGLTSSDVEVENRCSMALSKHLTCWCYQEYGRPCPLEKNVALE